MPSPLPCHLLFSTLLALPLAAHAQQADSVARPLPCPRFLVAVQPFFNTLNPARRSIEGGSLRAEYRLTEGFTLGLRASIVGRQYGAATHSNDFSEKQFYYEAGLTARYYFGRRAPRGFYAEWGLYAGELHREFMRYYPRSDSSPSHNYDGIIAVEAGAGYQWVLFRHAVLDLGLRVRKQSHDNYTGSGALLSPTIGLGIAF